MIKKKNAIEILMEEYEKYLETLTLLQLNRLLAEADNNKISY